MEYSEVRTLVERWLQGESTLGQEAVLREFFAGAEDGLPADLEACRLLFGQSAGAAAQRPSRKLILHTEPAPRLSRRTNRVKWLTVATGAAAAAVVTAIAILTPPPPSPTENIVCMVNGVRITDPSSIAAYTREALEIASDNLKRPGATLSSNLAEDPGMARVGEMLNELTKNQKQR
jgi:hypothetical protein